MPTYTVSAPAGQLDAAARQAIARDVTATHERVTGARAFFAQVVFVDVDPTRWFIGGAPLDGPQLFLHGQIRGGRSADLKRDLLLGLRDASMRASGLPATRVWCYLVELPPSQMVEYGQVLPEPGHEAEWLAALPDADRVAMERVGTP